jgi:prepilin-type N-terminal cleavage/methylation domain-containing protein
MSVRRNEGFTFVEVLIVMSVSLVLLTATLAVFNAMERNTKRNQDQNAAQTSARNGIDLLAQRLRNLANPVAAGGSIVQPIERATATDLVFRSVKPTGTVTGTNTFNVQRERYCVDSGGKLWRDTQTWVNADPGIPAGTACPGTGWTSTRVVAQNVVNDVRPVFSYIMSPTVSEQTSVAAASFPDVQAIRAELFVDPNPAVRPLETEISTRVFLRNQNRAPLADFTATCGASRQVVLNGSPSSDPEGGALTFAWYDGTTKIGTGVTYTTSSLSVGTHSLSLKVTDAGDLTTSAPPKTVTITSTTCAVS